MTFFIRKSQTLILVVDTAAEQLVPRLRQTNGRNRHVRLDEIHGGLLPRVPDTYTPVVAPAYQYLLAAFGDLEAVYDFFVADVLPYAPASFDVPGGDGGVGAGGEEDRRVAGPVESRMAALWPMRAP